MSWGFTVTRRGAVAAYHEAVKAAHASWGWKSDGPEHGAIDRAIKHIAAEVLFIPGDMIVTIAASGDGHAPAGSYAGYTVAVTSRTDRRAA